MFVLVFIFFSSTYGLVTKQQHFNMNSIKISEEDYTSFFGHSFNSRSKLQCTVDCQKTESPTILFSPDTGLCSCNDFMKPQETSEGKTVTVIQQKMSYLGKIAVIINTYTYMTH